MTTDAGGVNVTPDRACHDSGMGSDGRRAADFRRSSDPTSAAGIGTNA